MKSLQIKKISRLQWSELSNKIIQKNIKIRNSGDEKSAAVSGCIYSDEPKSVLIIVDLKISVDTFTHGIFNISDGAIRVSGFDT